MYLASKPKPHRHCSLNNGGRARFFLAVEVKYITSSRNGQKFEDDMKQLLKVPLRASGKLQQSRHRALLSGLLFRVSQR